MADEREQGRASRTVRENLYEEHLTRCVSRRAEDESDCRSSNVCARGSCAIAQTFVSRGAAISHLTGANVPAGLPGQYPRRISRGGVRAQPRVGQCAFEPALTGDGAITSVALLARTGTHEYVLLDPTRRGSVVAGWLTFLSQVSSNGNAPYEGTSVEEASGMLVPLLIMGARANELLADYLPSAARALPARGAVESVTLDGHIPALLVGMPVDIAGGVPAYVLPRPKDSRTRDVAKPPLVYLGRARGPTAVLGTWSQPPLGAEARLHRRGGDSGAGPARVGASSSWE